MSKSLLKATFQTIYMVFFSSLFSTIIGGFLGIVLVVTDKNGIKRNKFVYSVLSFFVNLFRSVPFLILIIYILPISKALINKMTGPTAAIIPLTVSAIPFVARIFENALKEVDYGTLEASISIGSSDREIIKVMLSEALPTLVNGITLTVINLIGYSAMAGTVGAQGLGDLAITYGYHRFDYVQMTVPVVIIILLVQIIQLLGNYISKRINKKISI